MSAKRANESPIYVAHHWQEILGFNAVAAAYGIYRFGSPCVRMTFSASAYGTRWSGFNHQSWAVLLQTFMHQAGQLVLKADLMSRFRMLQAQSEAKRQKTSLASAQYTP